MAEPGEEGLASPPDGLQEGPPIAVIQEGVMLLPSVMLGSGQPTELEAFVA
jgi:hypothetical protein